jgi:hypothetical protein
VFIVEQAALPKILLRELSKKPTVATRARVILPEWNNAMSALVAKELAAVAFPHRLEVVFIHTVRAADDVSGHGGRISV